MHRLHGIPYSPWTVRAQVALRMAGIAHSFHEFIPGVSEPLLRLALRRPFGRLSVPVLLPDDGPPLLDSLDIAFWADDRAPDRGVAPPALRDAISTWNAHAEVLMGAGRTRTLERVLREPAALAENVPPWLRWLGPVATATTAVVVRQVIEKYRQPDQLEAMREPLEALRNATRGGGPLLGDRLGHADVVMAAALQFVDPVGGPLFPLGPAYRPCWREPTLAEEFADLLAWRDGVWAELG